MKRIWIGLGVLLGLLAVGLFTMWLADHRLSEVSWQLETAAREENWDRAVALSDKAKALWEENRYFSAALSDHTDIDQIDGIFAQLEVYVHRREKVAHAAACAYLSEAITDLEENHRLTWWNLL
jgi:hypothetical protein